jgi:hypothetical protein
MKPNILKPFLLCVCTINFSAESTQLAILKPGFYQLGENFVVSPTGNDTIITIAASDVTLDFNGHFISQTNTTANLVGVNINPSLSDIVVQNGVIQNITGTGISIGASAMRVEILNMTFTNCSAAALTADGTLGTINNLEIRGCTMSGCCSNSTDRNVAFFSHCNRSRMIDCMLDNTINSLTGAANQTTEFAMISAAACSMCTFKNIWIQNNTFQGQGTVVTLAKPNANMIQESGNNNCEFNSILIRNNQFFSSTNCSFNGFRALTACDSNRYIGCQFIGNTVLNTLANGFNGFLGAWTNSVFSRCFVTSCSSNGTGDNGSTGIQTSLGSNANAIKDCVIVGNTSSLGFNGITSNDTNSLFNGCIVAYNASVGAASAIGMSMAPATGHSVLYENIVHRNAAPTNANSFGIFINATRGYLLSRNIAYSNGTIAANQFSNVSVASQTQITSDLVGTVTPAWTNLAVTQ